MNRGQKRCWLCDSVDVVNESCTRCHRPYCKEDMSKIDPAKFCDDCLRDVEIEERVYSKNTTEWDMWTDSMHVTGHRAKVIKFKGIDWMFACNQICQYPTDELRDVFEYHRGMVTQMANELASRDVRRTHEQTQAPQPQPQIQHEVKTKTIRTAKIAAKQQSLQEQVVEFALKNNMSATEAIEFLLQNKGKVQ